MVSEETSVFACGACGTRAPSTRIEYDRLGYAVCPACGEATGPLAGGRGDRRRVAP